MDAPRWKVECYDLVDSTNSRAIDRVHEAFANDRPIHRTAILAMHQTAGRGQHGRGWESPPGGLYLSAVLEQVPPTLRPLLPLIAGLAVIEGLAACNYGGAMLRWPNDLLFQDRKVAGVLCESVAQGNRWAAIVGIGVNIQVDIDTLPPSLQHTATSIHLHHPIATTDLESTTIRVRRVSRVLVLNLEGTALRSAQQGIPWLLDRVRRVDALKGKAISFQVDDRIVQGIAAGIGDSGELLIAVDNRTESFPRGTLLAVQGVQLRPRPS